MAPLSYDLYIQQGETYKKVFQWLDAFGNPKPIANRSARMQIKPGYNTAAVLTMTTQTKEIILTDGFITLSLTREQTRQIPVVFKAPSLAQQIYYYDLFLFDDQESDRFMAGTVTVSGALTDGG